MSAIVSSSPVASECIALNVEKKVRMPTSLPAKYGKFIQFGYFLMNKLNSIGESVEDGEVPPPVVDEQVFLDKLMVFEPLENQQAFVEEFFKSSKEINQGLRKMVQIRKRELAKASSQKKPKKEKKEKKPKKESEGEGEPKEKKVRGKKAKQPTTEDQLVNELVQLATTEEPVSDKSKKDAATAAVAELIAEIPPIAPKIVKKKVVVPDTTNEPLANEPVSSQKKEKKEKVVKEKKEKVVKEKKEKVVEKKVTTPILPPTPPKNNHNHNHNHDNQDDDDDELQVTPFEHNSIQYLIDDDLTIYDLTTQLPIGNFINHTFTLY